MCWFEAGITKSSGTAAAAAGLGLLDGSLCVHYNNEPERRAAYLEAVGDGMPGGYGLDDYAGLIWEGDGRPSAVTARRGARAYRVTAPRTASSSRRCRPASCPPRRRRRCARTSPSSAGSSGFAGSGLARVGSRTEPGRALRP